MTSGLINTSQVKGYIWTALLLCCSISQVDGSNNTRISRRSIFRRNPWQFTYPNQLPGRWIRPNHGQVDVMFPDQLRGVQTLHQTQKTMIPSLAKCGRSPARFGKKNTVQTIKPRDFPWLAAVGYLKNQQSINGHIIQKRHFIAVCGGTLITDRHVLSAAHCFLAPSVIRNQPTHVRLGEHDLRKDEDASLNYRIVDKQTHNFNRDTIANDIILLKLERHVKFNGQISPACLPIGIPEETYSHKYLTVVGWGMTTKSDHKSSPTPMREEPAHVPLWECQQKYRRHGSKDRITSNNICAGKGDADACMGDSGGPLNFRSSTGSGAGRVFVVGIVSFGPTPCGSSHLPGVYTNVAKYQNWITNNLN